MTNSDRFAQIYNDYSGLIFAFAARRTANVDDAADVVAETFTVAWRRIADVPAGEEARPWLYGVARRVAANQHRTIERRTRLDERLRRSAAIALTAPADPDPDRAETESVLALLSASDRELLTLSVWDDLDISDLTIVLGCSAATARVRLHRARRRFESFFIAQRGNK